MNEGGRKPSTHSSGSGSDLVYGDESPHLSPRSASGNQSSCVENYFYWPPL